MIKGHDRGVLRRLITMTALLSLLAPAISLAEETEDCLFWHDFESGGPFIPEIMEVRLSGDVGPDMENQLFGVLQEHLTTYPSLKTVNILLSSVGGYIESGFKIHNYLRGLHERHGLQVVTHNTGSVQSAAIDIYCSGNQRIASPYSFFMVHDSSRELEGDFNVRSIKDFEEENRLGSASSHRIFSTCTNVPIAEVDSMFAEQTYFDPDQALELGLTHSITPATYDRAADIRCLIEASDEEDEEE